MHSLEKKEDVVTKSIFQEKNDIIEQKTIAARNQLLKEETKWTELCKFQRTITLKKIKKKQVHREWFG